MIDADLQMKAMDVLFNMYSSLKNVQLQGAESPLVANSIEKLYMNLQEILKQASPFIFAESEKQALLCGILLNENEQKTIQVSSLLEILRDFGLQSISFEKGLLREELHIFIRLLAKNPKAVQFDGGLLKLIKENKIAHIYADKKTYILSEKHQEIPPVDISADKDKSPETHILPGQDSISKDISDMMNALSLLGEMDESIESSSSKQQIELINRLSGQVIEWIKIKTAVTPDYKKICLDIQKLLQEFIKHKLFDEVIPVLNVFNDINTGALQKDNKVREVALEVLRNLASENNINILFQELHTNESNKKNEAGQLLAGFGHILVNKLLDTIRNSNESKERIRTIHLVEEIGRGAIPVIKERIININAPWYFLRNLAYILGRIGDETIADILQPLLLHKDKRVRMDAFKSIIQIGGDKKGSLLLSVLHQVDQEFRVTIIEMLGKIRFSEAVPDLLDMLTIKSSLAKDDLISMQEKICNALGIIGSAEAVEALTEISESKSFLGMGSYPTEVKYAAKRALASIQRKQEESVKK